MSQLNRGRIFHIRQRERHLALINFSLQLYAETLDYKSEVFLTALNWIGSCIESSLNLSR